MYLCVSCFCYSLQRTDHQTVYILSLSESPPYRCHWQQWTDRFLSGRGKRKRSGKHTANIL